MGDQEETPIELSDEMLEAIRILKSDGHTQDLKDLKQSHAAIIERLDREAEERKNAPKEENPIPKIEGEGSGTPGGNPSVPESPEPPPKIETPVEPPKSGKKPWWENYPQG